MRITGPTNPFHIARTYGPTMSPAARPASGADRLVAGKVPGGVSFTPSTSATGATNAAAYPLYTHPADRNAAATGVALGQRIDVAG